MKSTTKADPKPTTIIQKVVEKKAKAPTAQMPQENRRRFRAEVEETKRPETPLSVVFFLDPLLAPLAFTKDGVIKAQKNLPFLGRIDVATLQKGDTIFDPTEKLWTILEKIHKPSLNPRFSSELYIVLSQQEKE